MRASPHTGTSPSYAPRGKSWTSLRRNIFPGDLPGSASTGSHQKNSSADRASAASPAPPLDTQVCPHPQARHSSLAPHRALAQNFPPSLACHQTWTPSPSRSAHTSRPAAPKSPAPQPPMPRRDAQFSCPPHPPPPSLVIRKQSRPAATNSWLASHFFPAKTYYAHSLCPQRPREWQEWHRRLCSWFPASRSFQQPINLHFSPHPNINPPIHHHRNHKPRRQPGPIPRTILLRRIQRPTNILRIKRIQNRRLVVPIPRLRRHSPHNSIRNAIRRNRRGRPRILKPHIRRLVLPDCP